MLSRIHPLSSFTRHLRTASTSSSSHSRLQLTFLRIFLRANSHVVSGSSISQYIESQISQCPSDTYILVSQPGATADVYSHADPVPHMKAKLSGSEKNIRSRIIIDAVRGDVNVHSMSRTLQEKCGATDVRIDASSERNNALLDYGIYTDLGCTFSWFLRNR